MSHVLCQEGCTVSSLTQAGTDWQLSLAEPLLITSIYQSVRHGRLWVTSPEIQMQKFGRLYAQRRESEKVDVVINIAI